MSFQDHPERRIQPRELVRLDGVAQRLGDTWALRGVALEVRSGEALAVSGHNGSGKTTLLRVIATALRPTRGEGLVAGLSLRCDAEAIRHHVALLAHSGGHYAELTARENLAFALRMLGRRPDRHHIEGALAWAGIEHAADRRTGTFSSGMRRRLALAAVRIRQADVLLMDEPYNSLDDVGVLLTDELVNETTARGGCAIVVLHDLSRSGAFFDRSVELRGGRVAVESAFAERTPVLQVPASAARESA